MPTGNRSIFYKLIDYGYPKCDKFYGNTLTDALTNARRARNSEWFIDYRELVDDGAQMGNPWWWSNPDDLVGYVTDMVTNYEEDRQAGNCLRQLVWVEAMGLVAAVRAGADPYSVRVISSGGQDTSYPRMQIAHEIADSGVPWIIHHIGDYDGQGCSIYDVLTEDIPALVEGLGGPEVVVRRLAVHPEQVNQMGLATRKAKGSKLDVKYGISMACEAESIPLDVLRGMVSDAIRSESNPRLIGKVKISENMARDELRERLRVSA